MLGEPVPLDDRVDVVPQLVALGEEGRPVGVGLERVRVEVVRDVDPQVGEAVLVPRPADRVVLLVDRVRDPELLEPDRRADAPEAGADDADGELREHVGRRRERPREVAGVAAVEVAFVAGERDVRTGDVLAGAEPHDVEQEVVVEWRRVEPDSGARGPREILERVDGTRVEVRPLVVGERTAPPSVVEVVDGVAREPRAVAGEVRQRAHERERVGAGDGSLERQRTLHGLIPPNIRHLRS